MTTTPTSGAADLPESLRASHGQAPYPATAPAQSCDCSQGQVCQVCDPVLPVQEAEREAFEAWFSVKLLPMGHEHPFMQRNSRGEYNRGDTAARWEAWQARAVLAKGGTPAGAGEPFGYFHQLLNHEGKGNGVWLGAAERKVVEQAHTPGETSEEIVTLYTTPQPTQTQPVARESLTDEQIQDLLLCGNPTDEEMRLIRIGWDAANGIKGANHDR